MIWIAEGARIRTHRFARSIVGLWRSRKAGNRFGQWAGTLRPSGEPAGLLSRIGATQPGLFRRERAVFREAESLERSCPNPQFASYTPGRAATGFVFFSARPERFGMPIEAAFSEIESDLGSARLRYGSFALWLARGVFLLAGTAIQL